MQHEAAALAEKAKSYQTTAPAEVMLRSVRPSSAVAARIAAPQETSAKRLVVWLDG